jgi:NAD+ kinase
LNAINRITIAGNIKKVNQHRVTKFIIESFKKNNFHVNTITPIKYQSTKDLNIEDVNQSNTDLLCILGGDGTIIGVIRSLSKQIPILGINVGSKGVLTEIFPDEIDLAIDSIKRDRFHVQEHMMLKIDIGNHGKKLTALNEILLYRGSLTELPQFTITQKELLIKKRMDGLIISTPTGSTGHSFSLDGPVLDETLDAFLLNFIGSVQRLPSIVVQPLPLSISCSNRANLVVDGQVKQSLERNKVIKVERNEEKAKFLKVFTGRLSQIQKLGFDIIG